MTTAEVARRAHISPRAVARWITRGVRAGDARIRLRATRYPNGWQITPADLDAFLAALTAARLGESPRPTTDMISHAIASARCAAAGL